MKNQEKWYKRKSIYILFHERNENCTSFILRVRMQFWRMDYKKKYNEWEKKIELKIG